MSSAPLSPCPACARHVRVDSARCPFCAVSLDGSELPVVPDAPSRLGRAALFAFATTVAAVGCNRPAQSGNDSTIVQPYGAPPNPPRPADAGMTPVATPPTQDPGLVVAIYGAPMPPPDASMAPTPPTPPQPHADPAPRPQPHTQGPAATRYGAPPPPDFS